MTKTHVENENDFVDECNHHADENEIDDFQ